MKQPTKRTRRIKSEILKLWRGHNQAKACVNYPWEVLAMVQAGTLTILDTELINILYKLEPTQTARVLKFASLEPTQLEVLINHKLYKADQIHAAALSEPDFALGYYSHVLKPHTRFQCEALL